MTRRRAEGPSRAAGERRGKLAVGATLELEVTDMALDGDPLGRVDDFVVFATGAIPGERVRVRVVSSTRKFARGDVLAVLRPSPHRVEPGCRHFGPCGGCTWQHIAYPEQLALKRRMLASVLETALGRPVPVDAMLGIREGGKTPWGFRNKVHFVLAGVPGRSLVMGHYRRGSRAVIEVEECPVHPEEGNRTAFRAREILRKHGIPGVDAETLRGMARHLVVRVSESTRKTQATLVVTRAESGKLLRAAREIAAGPGAPDGLHLNFNPGRGPYILGRESRRLHGEERLREEVAGAAFTISPKSFFQTNVRAAEILVEVVLGCISPGERGPILDLFAGAGLFSIPLARRGQRVTAVEESPAAVADGIASLRLNGLTEASCRFLRARAEDALRELDAPRGPAGRRGRGAGRPVREDARHGTVIIDPPHEGCPPGVWHALLRRLRPGRIVYVSCNPRALAGDALEASRQGYRVERVQPVDMFPHTAHIEAVAVLAPGPAVRLVKTQ